jgi:hypothetical protein
MWYFIIFGIIALWVFIDAKERKSDPALYTFLTLIIGIIALPIYLANRNLKPGEIREGGRGWNIMKNFIILWSILCVIWGLYGVVLMDEYIGGASGGAEEVGAFLGVTLGFGMIFGVWLIFTVGALVIGLLIKKSSVVERGPTGELALDEGYEECDHEGQTGRYCTQCGELIKSE